ncbi:MAG TPA: hypothetical protein VMH90_04900 [Thermoplasmata archaeon]|nr:hypothetical protein [Thermoplasmata archaeon]
MGPALLLLATAALVISSAAASAVAPNGNQLRPFTGTVTPFDAISTAGCGGKGKMFAAPSFSLTTGHGRLLNASTSARVCKAYSQDYAEVDGGFQLAINLTTVKGTNRLYVNGSYAVNGSVALTPGTCTITGSPSYADCQTEASIVVFGYADLVDVSTSREYALGPIVNVSKTVLNSTYWSGSGISYSSAGTSGPLSVTGTFARVAAVVPAMYKHDHYQLLLTIKADTIAEVITDHFGGRVTLTGAVASTTLEMAGHGHGFTLTSIGES